MLIRIFKKNLEQYMYNKQLFKHNFISKSTIVYVNILKLLTAH
jgi:hypothetical protein